jgi:hypothetical protein
MAGPKNLVKPGFGAERMAFFTRRESAIGRATSGLIGLQHCPGACRLGVDELEAGGDDVVEQSLPSARAREGDHEAELVNEAGLDERLNEVEAPVHLQFPPRLGLEVGPYLTTAPVQDLQPVTENCWGRVRVSCSRACDASRHALLAIGIRAP